MKSSVKKIIVIILTIVLIGTSIQIENVDAASTNITIEQYIELLIKAMKITVDKTQEDPYIAAAMKSGIILSDEFANVNKEITRAECALLTNRADEILHGKSDLEKTFEDIVTQKRISDLKKIDKEYRDAVVEIFGKGIIIGYSNGLYSQSREFKGNNKISVNGAKNIIDKLVSKKKRSIMSPDGQLTRTTNLPVNAKEYNYILASFPNKFYTMKFNYELGTFDEYPKYLDESFYKPSRIRKKLFKTGSYEGTAEETHQILDNYLDDWANITEDNLNYYFNVDYKTVDSKWVKKLLSTYYTANDEEYKYMNNKINTYVKAIKKNKVKIECNRVVVEPSTLYYANGYYLRAYVKYRIVSAQDIKGTIFFGDAYMKNLKVGEWRECYYDIWIGGGYWSYGDDKKVCRLNYLSDYAMEYKTKILKLRYNKEKKCYYFN